MNSCATSLLTLLPVNHPTFVSDLSRRVCRVKLTDGVPDSKGATALTPFSIATVTRPSAVIRATTRGYTAFPLPSANMKSASPPFLTTMTRRLPLQDASLLFVPYRVIPTSYYTYYTTPEFGLRVERVLFASCTRYRSLIVHHKKLACHIDRVSHRFFQRSSALVSAVVHFHFDPSHTIIYG